MHGSSTGASIVGAAAQLELRRVELTARHEDL